MEVVSTGLRQALVFLSLFMCMKLHLLLLIFRQVNREFTALHLSVNVSLLPLNEAGGFYFFFWQQISLKAKTNNLTSMC